MSVREVTAPMEDGAIAAPGRTSGTCGARPQRLPRLGYLGPARVLETAGSAARVRLEGKRAPVEAALALAVPYQVRRDDRLLVVGDAGRYWAIGVLHGRGAIELSPAAGTAGGVALHAVAGRLRLSADRAIRVGGGRQLRMLASERLSIRAIEIHRRADSVMQRIREQLELVTADCDEITDHGWRASAQRVALEVRTLFRLNSRSVRLG